MNESPVSSDSNPESLRYPRWINVLFSVRLYMMIAALLLVYPGFYFSNLLRFNQSIESFYSPDNPELKDFLQSRGWFGGDEILLVVWNQPNLPASNNLLTEEGLLEVSEFEENFKSIPGIDPLSVQSIKEMLAPSEDKLVLNFMLKFPKTQHLLIGFSEGFLISENHETVGILLRLLPENEAKVPRIETYKRVREIASKHKYPAHVVGEPIQVHDMFQYVQKDGALLGWSTMIIVTVVLLLLFLNLRWVMLPVLVVTIAIYFTRSLLYFSDVELSMVSSILNSLMMIIGVATLTHLIVIYRDYRTEHSREDSLKLSFKALAVPILWTTITTIMGFASLLSSSISPVRSFGSMVAIGTFMVLLISVLLAPGIILAGPVADPRSNYGEKGMERFLNIVSSTVINHPFKIVFSLISLMGICGYGMTFLKVETDFSKNFRSSSPIVQALDFVEKNLGGAGTWEINFKAPPVLDEQFITRLNDVTQKLRDCKQPGSDKPAFTKVISITDGLNMVPNINMRWPAKIDTTSPEKKIAFINNFQKEFEANLYKRQHERMRIILRGYERLPAEIKLHIIKQAENIAGEQLDDVHATGLYVMLANLIQSLLGDQLLSFAISAFAIFVMMAIAFRSMILGFICLVPNVFPLLILMGVLGWLGVPTNIGTAMIASVSLGLTVDSSIHYLTGYLQVIKSGGDHPDAVMQTGRLAGLALVFANLALVLGFMVLTMSNFIPLVYFGVLVSLAMLGGLIGNLVLLPALLNYVFPTRLKTL